MSRGPCRFAPPRQPLPPPPPPPANPPIIFGWLRAANPAFWEEYRRGGRRPVEINFLGLPPAVVVNDNVPEPFNNAAVEPQVNDGAGEEAHGSVSALDLTLGL